MLNDEIESVVINAINSLKKMGDRVRLTEEQVDPLVLLTIDGFELTINALVTHCTIHSPRFVGASENCAPSTIESDSHDQYHVSARHHTGPHQNRCNNMTSECCSPQMCHLGLC